MLGFNDLKYAKVLPSMKGERKTQILQPMKQKSKVLSLNNKKLVYISDLHPSSKFNEVIWQHYILDSIKEDFATELSLHLREISLNSCSAVL